MFKRLLAKVHFRAAPDYDGEADFDSPYPNAITSQLDRTETSAHLPIFDIDAVRWSIIPSRTNGHQHIYIDAAISWEHYAAIITALLNAALIDPRWAEATLRQHYGTLRLPWMLDESLAVVKPPEGAM